MLPRHPVYRKLDAPVTVLGVDLEDWFGLGVAFMVVSRVCDLIVGHVLHAPRAEAVVSACTTGILFACWRRLKDRTPRHFLRHLLAYLAEPDAYVMSPDPDANPYVV